MRQSFDKMVSMSTAQLHEKFETFTGSSIADLSAQVGGYAAVNAVAVKSLSVLYEGESLIASIGYIDGVDELYSVSIVDASVQVGDLTTNLTAAATSVEGEVLCHSLFLTPAEELRVAFLVYEQ